ncbi:DUF2850 domain-containing protein [Vibrio quintilis]|uniref:DUF2850 domain-containing protein n=1 Tax=Vibrio quintilis TaxID=1117707 RepID=A0A1M7YWP2_9VIBR|nr:DUF2850 domain-containing protein [Vibrio quintilis]SHO57002.1 hypothetical protein VQ7734_02771 [Vibrio quintilis]
MKSLLALLGVLLLVLSGFLIYKGYEDYTNPKLVYGNWLEIKVLGDRRDVIRFDKQGVYRNNHLITTKFEYDGKTIRFKTGGSETIYQLSGTENSPQLKRVEPSRPIQTLIKEGYEHTLNKPSALRMVPRRTPFGAGDDDAGK